MTAPSHAELARPSAQEHTAEVVAMAAKLKNGVSPQWLAAHGYDPQLLARAAAMAGKRTKAKKTNWRPPPWTQEEEDFLRDNLGKMTMEEIGEALGRPSGEAVNVRRKKLGLPPQEEAMGLSFNQVKAIFGQDTRKIYHMMLAGDFPAEEVDIGRRRWVIQLEDLYRWALKPEHWPHFDQDLITGPKLKRWLKIKAEEWGDEWLLLREAAEILDVTQGYLINRIHSGVIKSAVQSGRPHSPWYVLRSEVESMDLSRRVRRHWYWAREKGRRQFLIIGYAIGLPAFVLTDMMRMENEKVAVYVAYQRDDGALAEYIESDRLPVGYRHDGKHGVLWADWRDYRHRFHLVDNAVRRFMTGQKMNHKERVTVQRIMQNWLRWFGDMSDPEQNDLDRRLKPSRNARPHTMREQYSQMKAWGIDPFEGEADGEATNARHAQQHQGRCD